MRTFFSNLVRSFRKTEITQAPAAATMPVEDLESRRLFASSLAYGINANAVTSSNYSKIVGMLRDTGTQSVRLWVNLNSYNSRSESGIFKYVRRFSSDGFDTTVTVVPSQGGASYDSVRNSFAWLADKRGDSVDRWQAGN